MYGYAYIYIYRLRGEASIYTENSREVLYGVVSKLGTCIKLNQREELSIIFENVGHDAFGTGNEELPVSTLGGF